MGCVMVDDEGRQLLLKKNATNKTHWTHALDLKG
jgi:hypothetical protein